MGRPWLGYIALVASTFVGGMAAAQQDTSPFVRQDAVISAIVTVDIDRLFTQSQFGERISREFNEAGTALSIENRRIADALREEELALARQRPDMDPDVFRTEAAAFDEKTQGIRRTQDAKREALDASLTEGRTQFIEVSRPILGELMVDRGAFAILDRRSVVLSLGSVDVTDEAIARINATIGDGSNP
jgi:Skp family chaperone for outer membrane proteins